MSTTDPSKAPPELRRRNYYQMHPDVVLIRVPFPMRTFRPLKKLASGAGLSVAELTAVLIGPDPWFVLPDIIDGRDEALGDRRLQLQRDRQKKL
jgi:hypothetical protein